MHDSNGNEPIYAQIIKKARALGFRLVAYEDTAASTKGDDSEKWQAVNLYQKIKTGGTIARTVVLASYGQLSEDSVPDLKTMAWYFKLISKTDPLTVDQLDLMEDSPENATARKFFEHICGRRIKIPVAVNKAAMQAVMDSSEKGLHVCPFDLYVYHPHTEYGFGRPKWLLTKGKTPTAVEIPKDLPVVLVQAYLAPEISSANDYGLKVPFDQAFQVYKQHVYLLLDRSMAYKVVFRDEANKIIRTETVLAR